MNGLLNIFRRTGEMLEVLFFSEEESYTDRTLDMIALLS